MDALTSFDFSILYFIQEHLRSDTLDMFMATVTRWGDKGLLWVVPALILMIFPRTRMVGAAMFIGLVAAIFLGELVLKPIVARARPFMVDLGMTLLIPPPSGYSFPSSHAISSFAIVGALFGSRKTNPNVRLLGLAIIALVIACAIAFSRLYLFVHFPSDVITGTILGFTVGWATARMLPHLKNRFWNQNKQPSHPASLDESTGKPREEH